VTRLLGLAVGGRVVLELVVRREHIVGTSSWSSGTHIARELTLLSHGVNS
jgi:hypothetical protein